MTKKIIAVLLSLIMIAALVGCGSKKREVVQLTLSTEDSEAILSAAGIALPDAEVAAGAGTTVKWFAHYDAFQNYDEGEIVALGAWTFQEKYNGKLEWVETTWGSRWDDLALNIMGDTPADLFPGETAIFPGNVIKGMFQPVNDYIDYDDPLWSDMREYAETYFNLGGKIYAAVIDTDFGTVCPYNRRVMEEWGFNDPAEMFYNNEWTWDEFYDMCASFSEPDEDRYAVDGWFWSAALIYSAGKTVIELDPEACQFYSSADDPALERAADIVYELNRNECVYPRWNNDGWSTRNGGAEGAGIKDASCLFWPVGLYVLNGAGTTLETIGETWGDMAAGEIMFVPMPRDPNGDGNYYIQASPFAFVIINGAKNPDGAALMCQCTRFKTIDPVVRQIDRKQLKEKLLWTDEMLDMRDACMNIANGEHPIVDYGDGMGTELASINGTFMGLGTMRDAQSWAQLKEANSERLQYYIDELNKDINDFIERGGTFEG